MPTSDDLIVYFDGQVIPRLDNLSLWLSNLHQLGLALLVALATLCFLVIASHRYNQS